jgi:uncharacterized protein YdeI (YjbR/CyaY-like superfamily)
MATGRGTTSASRQSPIADRKSQIDHAHITPTSRKEWRAWLQKHHASAKGVWLLYAKKHTGLPSLTWQEGVEEALCFGWIDSLRRPVDDTYFKQLYTPRKPKSTWSAINKASIERLIAAGLMTAAGLAVIDAAKANGRWNAIDHVESFTIPDDFKKALANDKTARAGFESYSPFIRKQFLYRLNSAKRPETRAKRIAELLEAARSRRNPFRLEPKSSSPKPKR